MSQSNELAQVQRALDRIELKQQVITDRADEMAADIVTVRRILTGESEPERGMVLRLKRLEETVQSISDDYRSVKRWAWSAIGAACVAWIGALAKAVMS